jgi:hypothetical protein
VTFRPYLPAVRRLAAFLMLAVLLAACGYQPEIQRPGAATGITGQEPPPVAASTGPVSTSAAFGEDGCPVDDPAFCRQAAFLANALVLSDADAVFDLVRRVTVRCADVDASLFHQCRNRPVLEGYQLGSHQGEFVVLTEHQFRDTLGFLVEAVDHEYSDELGGPNMQILGVSTCGKGRDRSYHVVYTVALSDQDSTLPGDRFLGTYEFTEQGGDWAIETSYAALYSDWQLVLDDPLTEIACGDIQPWVGEAPNLNPPKSESQPTPIPTPSPTGTT